MHPRIKEVLDHLDAQHEELRDAVDAIPLADRQTQPHADRWSVTEVLEHIAIVDTNLGGMLKKRIAEGRAAGVGPESATSSVVNQRHVAKVRDRSERITAGEAALPKSRLDPETAWDAVQSAYAALRAVLVDADGLALGEISHPHRIFGPLNLYEWFVFTGSHESRHAAQIREIGDTLKVRSA